MHSCTKDEQILEINKRDSRLSKLSTTAEKRFFDKAYIIQNNNNINPPLVIRSTNELIDSLFDDLLELQLEQPFAEELIQLIGYPVWNHSAVLSNIDSQYQVVTIPFTFINDSLTQGILTSVLVDEVWHSYIVNRDTLYSLIAVSAVNDPNIPSYLVGMMYYDNKLFYYSDTLLYDLYFNAYRSQLHNGELSLSPRSCVQVTTSFCYSIPCPPIALTDPNLQILPRNCEHEECVDWIHFYGCGDVGGSSGGNHDVGQGLPGNNNGSGGSGGPDPGEGTDCGFTPTYNLPFLCTFGDDLEDYGMLFIDEYNALLPYLNPVHAQWFLSNYNSNLSTTLHIYNNFIINFSSSRVDNSNLLEYYLTYSQDGNIPHLLNLTSLSNLLLPHLSGLGAQEESWLSQNLELLNDPGIAQFLSLLGQVTLNYTEAQFAFQNRIYCYDIANNYPDYNLDYVIDIVSQDIGVSFNDFTQRYNNFRNLENPTESEMPQEIENGIAINSSYTPLTWIIGTPIGQNQDRLQVEDLEYGTNGNTAGINYNLLYKTSDELFADMNRLFDVCTTFGLNSVADGFIAKLRTNTTNNYAHENSDLSHAVRQHTNMRNFVKEWGFELNNKLIQSNGDINNIQVELGLFPRPQFSGLENRFNGLQILLNDTEHTTVELLDYNYNQNDGTWSASVIFDIDDHFGLDKKDALVYQGWHEGFGAWWMLQNKKGFVPFHTRVRNVFIISGDITP